MNHLSYLIRVLLVGCGIYYRVVYESSKFKCSDFDRFISDAQSGILYCFVPDICKCCRTMVVVQGSAWSKISKGKVFSTRRCYDTIQKSKSVKELTMYKHGVQNSQYTGYQVKCGCLRWFRTTGYCPRLQWFWDHSRRLCFSGCNDGQRFWSVVLISNHERECTSNEPTKILYLFTGLEILNGILKLEFPILTPGLARATAFRWLLAMPDVIRAASCRRRCMCVNMNQENETMQ